MRKLRSFYFAMMTIASLSFLTSCGDDEEEIVPLPTLDVAAGTGLTSSDVEVAANTPLSIKVIAKSNANGRNLKNFTIKRSDVTTALLDTAIGKENFDYTYNFTAPANQGTYTYTFTVTDRDDKPASRSVKVTVVGDMATYTAKILGNQNAGAGSFFSSRDGAVISAADSKANSAKIDFGYFYSVSGSAATYKATLASPTDVDGADVFKAIGSADFNNWATKNATEFKKVAGQGALYDNMTSGAQIESAYMALPATLASSKASDLKVGDLVGFMTSTGKHGVAKVTKVDVPTTANGNKSEITLAVKVQR